MAVPKFLKNAETTPEPRMYHGEMIQLWKGEVAVSDIEGWVGNPRIEMAIEELRDDIGGGQEITQKMVYDIMKSNRDVRLKDLRDDIIKNGLREPLMLSYAGKLIDGNRRFFAVKYALENADDGLRARLERVPAFVLTENARKEQELSILVEENFAPSLKKEWPPYVKARHIQEASDGGMKPKDIAKKFGWDTSQVKETLRTLEIADLFMAFARGEPDPETGADGLGMSARDAKKVVDEKYQYFNEAQKSLYNQLTDGKDPDFPPNFYKWLARGNCFASFHEVKAAYRAWLDPEAKEVLEKGGEGAGKDAKAILDYKRRVVKDDKDIEHRVENLVTFLRSLKADQMSRMPQHVLDKLRESLEMVVDMAESGKK